MDDIRTAFQNARCTIDRLIDGAAAELMRSCVAEVFSPETAQWKHPNPKIEAELQLIRDALK